MKKLTMSFLNAEGKRANLTLNAAKQDLTGEVVKPVMGQICELALFQKNNQPLYVQPESAKYTETIITKLF
ncbi:DUF2922 domain-containing protein [Vagococcus acidifermentans]|uniref:DUF2922 domain-containing protein n=1 Tax=Vagococcus acidifermentans TaxID=564710 RepID=A0A430ATV7_9ENTE|nr:DUF2922 domain-containing protein [Vagococcus acidifermentans]RSU11488.1 hypothetical protein CBF27_08315 [Vagococcus acidifermentans]